MALAEMILQDGAGHANGPLTAYLWARLAELRLSEGTLRTTASKQVADAARRLPAAEIADTEAMVKSLISAAQPSNR